MKIKLSDYDLKQFIIKEDNISDIPCFLVTPSLLGTDWTRQTTIFRSSIWDLEGNLVSAGFKKFVNFGEKEDIFTPPKSLNHTTAIEKVDGSALFLSKYKNSYIIRTRGNFDASKLKNGIEVQLFKDQILAPMLVTTPELNLQSTWDFTYCFEWTTPTYKIVLDYGNSPQWWFIGCIYHNDYSYLTQNALNNTAKIYNWKRPQQYKFDTITDLVTAVKEWKDREGICLYYNNDQNIVKIKAESYLIRHAFKEHCSEEAVIDLFLAYNKPSYSEFVTRVETQFDFECLTLAQPFISRVIDAYKEVLKIEEHMQKFVDSLNGLSRKDQATQIISSYGTTNRAGYVFCKLDRKPFDDKGYKKLLCQVLKN